MAGAPLDDEAARKCDDGVTVNIIPGLSKLDMEALPDKANVLVRISPPATDGKRQPTDLVCVIDTSGSMGMEAKIQDGGESSGLTLLDVAKHGVKTIAHTLGENDRLSLVTFSHQATTVFSLKKMDKEGQDLADAELDKLMPGGGTDIWNGLNAGLQALKAEPLPGRFAHVMLLTDGESTNREQIVPSLRTYRGQQEGGELGCTINTFGFGYNLDSKLLVNLANEGHGSYSFIPDAGFVGTAFVHSVSNLLATMGMETQLTLKVGGDFVFLDEGLPGARQCREDPTNAATYIIELGTMQYGQSKDVLVPMKIKTKDTNYLDATVTYRARLGEHTKEANAKVADSADKLDVEVEKEFCRCKYVDAVTKAVAGLIASSSEEQITLSKEVILEAIVSIGASEAAGTDSIKALLEDLTGQTTEAMSRLDWYKKWGCHYLPSIVSAHGLQQCNNFKDPGVQVYGGEVFKSVRDEADDIFNELPPPKPKPRNTGGYGGGGAPAPAAPVNMAAYNNRFAG